MKFCFAVLALVVPMLAQEGTDISATLDSLKAAVEKKDVEGVKKLAGQASAEARKIIAAPATSDDDKKRVEYAKDVDRYAEYSLSAIALQTTDPKVAVDLTEQLGQLNPKSEYLTQ